MSEETRYFILSSKAKEDYLQFEEEESKGLKNMIKVLIEDRDDIEEIRINSNGTVAAVMFKDGKTPEDVPFVRAHKRLSKVHVRPHGKSPAAKEWREMLQSLKTVMCREAFIQQYKLPTMVLGGPSKSGFGATVRNSNIGHVGPEVIACVPIPNSSESNFNPPEYFTEIKKWEFEKLKDDNSEYEYGEEALYLAK